MALAGLWAGWKDPASDPDAPRIVRTFTIITSAPNRALADLHDRMPVIVPDDAWARWLDPTPAEPGELIGLLQPTDELALRIYAVNRDVNDVRRDGPELIEPLTALAEDGAPAAGSLGL